MMGWKGNKRKTMRYCMHISVEWTVPATQQGKAGNAPLFAEKTANTGRRLIV